MKRVVKLADFLVGHDMKLWDDTDEFILGRIGAETLQSPPKRDLLG